MLEQKMEPVGNSFIKILFKSSHPLFSLLLLALEVLIAYWSIAVSLIFFFAAIRPIKIEWTLLPYKIVL